MFFETWVKKHCFEKEKYTKNKKGERCFLA